MPLASQYDGLSEIVQGKFGWWQAVIPISHVLHKHPFGLVARGRKRVQGMGEPFIQPGQRGDLLLRSLR